MQCDLSNVTLTGTKSGYKVRPLSVEVKRSRREANDFDFVQAKVTPEAAELIKNTAGGDYYKEPVRVETGANTPLYRGWIDPEKVTISPNMATVDIQDPRKALLWEFIDKEWAWTNLDAIVYYFLEKLHGKDLDPEVSGDTDDTDDNDPYNVIKHRPKFLSEDSQEVKVQHVNPLPTADNNPNYGVQVVRELYAVALPIVDSDGNFDFREETIHSALTESCNLWETSFWVNANGRLVIGDPGLNANVYNVGPKQKALSASDYDLPHDPQPLKGVYVKGKNDQKGGKDNWAEEVWNVATNKKQFQTRAYAGFTDVDTTNVKAIPGKKNTTDPKTLKSMAKRALMKEARQFDTGTITLDAEFSAEQGAKLNWLAKLKPGDVFKLLEHDHSHQNQPVACANWNPGLYRVNSVRHTINGTDGWTIDCDVAKIIESGLTTKFWYFDPTDPEMAANGGAP